ncbi:hypothetical protein SCLARK_00645 [Spiroplasma clarkii]|uniref:ABC transporter permease n=1 Tax=Spiroplasma clarkii TaxID=2139 RepID=UPI000B573963|nr:FtsX-like permease family protein [Spiroplasma clarkii]ARU91308.1 hypothetical protein SCLARK_00645 [Spiroplasma clarkii]
MLLFKNGFRKLIREYMQFLIFIILIVLAAIFTASFGIVNSNLTRTNNAITKNFNNYDYSFKYTSSGYKSNDTQTLNPWFAFNTDLVSKSQKENFATLTIGDNADAVLKPYEFNIAKNQANEFTYDSAIYHYNSNYYVNFGFGDTESSFSKSKDQSFKPTPQQAVINYSVEDKIKTVASGEFGRFYRFNFESKFFKNSLFGKLYAQNANFQGELSSTAIAAATEIFDYMFYLNNSAITSVLKATIAEYYEKNANEANINNLVENFVNGDGDNTNKTIADLQTNGFNGRIGNFVEKQYFLYNQPNFTKAFYTTNSNHYMIQQLQKNGTYLIKDFESRSLFWNPTDVSGFLINSKNITAKNLFETYFKLIGTATGFNLDLTSEVVMWNLDGQKFRYISAFYNETTEQNTTITKFYNEELYTIYDSFAAEDYLTRNSFMVSNGFVKANNWSLGKSYEIFPGFSGIQAQYRLDAIGVDAYNTYPTIYEEDLITNQNNEAIFYINAATFEAMFNHDRNSSKLLDDSAYQDVSRVYLNYVGAKTAKADNLNLFKLYLADNMSSIKEVQEVLNEGTESKIFDEETSLSRANVQSTAETPTLVLRSTMFPTVTSMFLVISIIFCLIFVSCILFMVYTITKKVMQSHRKQIGNLKSLGYSKFNILINYWLYMIIPITIITPIGWAISLFLQIPIMNIFEHYFNIPTMFTIDWVLLLILWPAFIGVNSLMVVLVVYNTVKEPSLVLLAELKTVQTNSWFTRFIRRFKVGTFSNKLRLTLVSVSWKGLTTFFGVILLSSFILTISSLVPSTIGKMNEEFFRNVNYANQFNYAKTIINNPLTRTEFYQASDDLKEDNSAISSFNTYVKSKNTDNYLNLLQDFDNWKNEDDNKYLQTFEDVFLNNVLTFKGVSISPGMLEEVITASGKINNPTTQSQVKKTINAFTCQVLPQLFGQDAIAGETNDYNDCIKSISNNLIPSTVKQMWVEDDNNFKNFGFNFSLVPYNATEDEMVTYVQASDAKTRLDLQVYGIDQAAGLHNLNLSKLDAVKYDAALDYIPVLISEKMRLQGYGVDSTFNLNVPVEVLTLQTKTGYNILQDSAWKYADQNHQIADLYTIDLDKLTYSQKLMLEMKLVVLVELLFIIKRETSIKSIMI